MWNILRAESAILSEGCTETCVDRMQPNHTHIYNCLESDSYTIHEFFLPRKKKRETCGWKTLGLKIIPYDPASTGGSVVEFSPATREARVRFPASAELLYDSFKVTAH